MNSRRYLISQYRVAQDEADSGAPSEEGRFFNNPEKREVREFAESEAISNSVEVTEQAVREDKLDEPKATEVRDAEEAPPTPLEIEEEPGGENFSTLNRYLVETEEAVGPGVPEGHEEVPKHPVLASRWASWTFVP